MFPKTGKKFPGRDDRDSGVGGYAAHVARALRQELGETHRAAKTLMRWAEVSERTAKHWLSGRHGPGGDHLVALMSKSSLVTEAILRAAGRSEAGVEATTDQVDRKETAPDIASTRLSTSILGHPPDDPLPASEEAAQQLNDRENVRDRVRDDDCDSADATLHEGYALNARQNWILRGLESGLRMTPREVENKFDVSEKTARRDFAALKRLGIVRYAGSARSGSYSL